MQKRAEPSLSCRQHIRLHRGHVAVQKSEGMPGVEKRSQGHDALTEMRVPIACAHARNVSVLLQEAFSVATIAM